MKTPFISSWIILGLFASFTSADEVLGKIGEVEVKTDEVRELISGLASSNGAALSNRPDAVNEYVRALLIQKLILQKATRDGWDKDPEVISKIVRARETVIAESYLESATTLPEGYPSDTEITAAYEKAKDGLLVPKSYRIAQIFVLKKHPSSRVDEIVAQLKKADADFGSLAAKYSDAADAASTQGEIGWVSENQLHTGLRDVVKSLAKDQSSAPVALDDGWHIVKLHETKDSRTPLLSEIKDQLVAQLRAQRLQLARQDYLAKLLKDHPLAINEIELLKLIQR